MKELYETDCSVTVISPIRFDERKRQHKLDTNHNFVHNSKIREKIIIICIPITHIKAKFFLNLTIHNNQIRQFKFIENKGGGRKSLISSNFSLSNPQKTLPKLVREKLRWNNQIFKEGGE